MPIELWYGKQFEQPHEREALVKFWNQLIKASNADNQLRVLVIESSIENASIDMLLISPHAIVIVELKSLLPNSPISNPERISLSGKENGKWEYKVGGHTFPLGGRYNDKNPFDQIKTYRAKVKKWIQANPGSLPSALTSNPSVHLAAWVAISPAFNNNTSELDLPWSEIGKWFDVVPFDRLADKFIKRKDPELLLTPEHTRYILNKLGLRQCQDISDLIPEVPPAPRIFSLPPRSPQIFARDLQLVRLREYIDNPAIAVINLGGQSGIGKTTLAAWTVSQYQDSNQVYWIDCADKKNLTVQMLLSAISENAPLDKQLAIRGLKAATFAPNEYTLTDHERIDMALELLSQRPSLLVFDDYHAIAEQAGMAAFIRHVLSRNGNLHVILTTHSNPYQSDWPSQAYRDIILDKLPLDAFTQFIRQLTLDEPPTSEQAKVFHQKVSGNPGVAQRCLKTFEQHRRSNTVEKMPIYRDQDVKLWLSASIDNLSRNAKEFAQTLSALGANERPDILLITQLWNGPAVEAMKLIDELVDKYVAKQAGHDLYVIDDLAADFLYAQMKLEQRDKAHRSIGQQLLQLAETTQDEWEKANLQAKAIQQLSVSGPRKKIPPIAQHAHDVLSKAGDWERAVTVLQYAVDAAHTVGNLESECAFALQLAEDQLFLGEDYISVDRSLQRAEQLIPATSVKPVPQPDDPWPLLQTRFLLLRGQLQYRRPDYVQASTHLQQALNYALRLNDKTLTVRCALQLGLVERRLQNWDRADEAFRTALSIARAQSDAALELDCIRNLGTIARKREDFATAHHYYAAALDLADRTGDALSREMALSGLGRLEDELSHPDKAAPLLEEALKIAHETHNTRGERIELTRLINVLIALRQIEKATELLQESEALNSKADDYIGLAWNLKHQGQLQQLAGDVLHGNDRIKEGIGLLTKYKITEHIEEFRAAIQQTSGD